MKKIIILTLISMGVFLGGINAQQPAALQLANKIADKMRDTLQLNEGKRNQVFAINMQLFNQKRIARLNVSNADSLRRAIQRIENKRDSLYNLILPTPKYNLYLQKKGNLINAN